MRVEDSKTPRRNDHEACHREENPDQDGRELAARPVEALRHDCGDRGRKGDTHDSEDAAREE